MTDDIAALVATAVKPTWLRAIPYLIALAAIAAACIGIYSFGVHTEHQARVAEVAKLNQQHKDALQQIDAAHRTQLQAATDLVRAQELKASQDMAAMDAKKTKELNDAKNAAATDIAALRSGGIRVRDEFTCAGAAGAGGEAGATATAPGLGHATQAGGLQAADAEVVLHIGAEADEVALQLQACQAIVTQDRAGASGAPQP